MSRALKTFLAVAIYLAIPFLALAFGFFFTHPHPHGPYTVVQVLVIVGIPLIPANAFAVLYGFIWIIRQLRGTERIGWAIAFFVGGCITECFWWWRFVRPLPEPA
jgi:hypothetical protein